MGTSYVKSEGKRRRESNVAGVSNKMPERGSIISYIRARLFVVVPPTPGQFTNEVVRFHPMGRGNEPGPKYLWKTFRSPP